MPRERPNLEQIDENSRKGFTDSIEEDGSLNVILAAIKESNFQSSLAKNYGNFEREAQWHSVKNTALKKLAEMRNAGVPGIFVSSYFFDKNGERVEQLIFTVDKSEFKHSVTEVPAKAFRDFAGDDYPKLVGILDPIPEGVKAKKRALS